MRGLSGARLTMLLPTANAFWIVGEHRPYLQNLTKWVSFRCNEPANAKVCLDRQHSTVWTQLSKLHGPSHTQFRLWFSHFYMSKSSISSLIYPSCLYVWFSHIIYVWFIHLIFLIHPSYLWFIHLIYMSDSSILSICLIHPSYLCLIHPFYLCLIHPSYLCLIHPSYLSDS